MCEFTEGRARICDTVAGSKRMFMWAIMDSLGLSNYTAPPTIVDGEITALNLKPTKYLYVFNVESETLDGQSNSIGEKTNTSTAYEHTTVSKFAGNTKEDIANAIKLCKGRVGVALELNDGSFEAFHYEDGIGGKVQRARAIGVALEDFNGSTLTITSKQTLPEMKISSVLVNSLLAP